MSYINPLLVNAAGFSENSMPVLMFISGAGMYAGNLFAGKWSDKYTPAVVSQYTQLTAAAALLLLFFFVHIPFAAICLIFVCSFCLFALSAPQQILIVEVSKGGEILGTSLAPLAFTLGNAIGAVAGGIPVTYGAGYQYAVLPGATFAFIGYILLMMFRKYLGE